MKFFIRKCLLYITVSLVNTLVGIATYGFLRFLSIESILSLVFVYLLCPIFNHLLYNKFVFKSTKTFSLYYNFGYVSTFFLNLLLLQVVKPYLNEMLAQSICFLFSGLLILFFNLSYFKRNHFGFF